MDDDDADYMQGSDDEVSESVISSAIQDWQHEWKDYGFDYSDNDETDKSGSADVENMYYTAKCEPRHQTVYVAILT